MSTYRVVGKQRFRGHEPGEVFVAQLEPGLEARALKRGDVELVESTLVALDATRASLPAEWIDAEESGEGR